MCASAMRLQMDGPPQPRHRWALQIPLAVLMQCREAFAEGRREGQQGNSREGRQDICGDLLTHRMSFCWCFSGKAGG